MAKAPSPATVKLTRQEKLAQTQRALAMAKAEISYCQDLVQALRVDLQRTEEHTQEQLPL